MPSTAIVPVRRGRNALYQQLCEPETLIQAWRSVRRSGGAGVDGETAAAFEAHWPENMAELAEQLQARTYHPQPLKAFLLPRDDGGQRPISLLVLRDRVVQRAVLDVVRSAFETASSPAAFGALPGRGVGAAIARAEQARRAGNTWIVQTDVRAFFEEVDQRRLLAAFRTTTRDGALTALVAEWLAIGSLRAAPAIVVEPAPAEPEAGADFAELPWFTAPSGGSTNPLLRSLRRGAGGVRTLEDELPSSMFLRPVAEALAGRAGSALLRRGRTHARGTLLGVGAGALAAGAAALLYARRPRPGDADPAGPRGTPQGAPLSPLLATSMLRPFDLALDRPDRVLVRYVDDILLVCRDERTALRALAEAQRQIGRLGLVLKEEKTIVQPYDAGFTYLGARLPQLAHASPVAPAQRILTETFRSAGYWRDRMLSRQRSKAQPAKPRRGR